MNSPAKRWVDFSGSGKSLARMCWTRVGALTFEGASPAMRFFLASSMWSMTSCGRDVSSGSHGRDE